ncbi:hypothetical protein ACKWTF_015784 [Chironomus riparius]
MISHIQRRENGPMTRWIMQPLQDHQGLHVISYRTHHDFLTEEEINEHNKKLITASSKLSGIVRFLSWYEDKMWHILVRNRASLNYLLGFLESEANNLVAIPKTAYQVKVCSCDFGERVNDNFTALKELNKKNEGLNATKLHLIENAVQHAIGNFVYDFAVSNATFGYIEEHGRELRFKNRILQLQLL